jgi:hypothetical protein
LLEWNRNEAKVIRWVGRLFPWEIHRAERLVEQVTQTHIQRFLSIQACLEQAKPVAFNSDVERELKLNGWRRTTFLGGAWFLDPRASDRIVNLALRRRATLTTLALLEWRWDHGTLPDSLDMLVGNYLEEIPIEPFFGRPFLYYPHGLDRNIRWTDPSGVIYVFELPKGSPALIAPMQEPLPAVARPFVITEPVCGVPYSIPQTPSSEGHESH